MDKYKKVAILLNDYSLLGGVEKVTSNLSFLLKNNQVNFFGIISLKNKNKKPKIKYAENTDVFIVNSREVVDFIILNEIDIVIVQVQGLYTCSILAKKISLAGVRVISVLHNTPYAYLKWHFKVDSFKNFAKFIRWFFYYKFFSHFFLKKIALFSYEFLMVSKSVEGEIKNILPEYLHSKISYIYNPVDIDFESEDFLLKKKNYIVYAGRFSEDKRVFESVIILSKLLSKYSDWEFIILGDGPEKDKIQKYLIFNNIRNIRLVGVVDDVKSYLKESKICLLYSKFEGLPTVLLEAMHAYNVLVSYDSYGGAKDIVINYDNGFIVKNDQELEQKIGLLLSDYTLVDKMMSNNKKHFLNFDNKKILSLWIKRFF